MKKRGLFVSWYSWFSFLFAVCILLSLSSLSVLTWGIYFVPDAIGFCLHTEWLSELVFVWWQSVGIATKHNVYPECIETKQSIRRCTWSASGSSGSSFPVHVGGDETRRFTAVNLWKFLFWDSPPANSAVSIEKSYYYIYAYGLNLEFSDNLNHTYHYLTMSMHLSGEHGNKDSLVLDPSIPAFLVWIYSTYDSKGSQLDPSESTF